MDGLTSNPNQLTPFSAKTLPSTPTMLGPCTAMLVSSRESAAKGVRPAERAVACRPLRTIMHFLPFWNTCSGSSSGPAYHQNAATSSYAMHEPLDFVCRLIQDDITIQIASFKILTQWCCLIAQVVVKLTRMHPAAASIDGIEHTLRWHLHELFTGILSVWAGLLDIEDIR